MSTQDPRAESLAATPKQELAGIPAVAAVPGGSACEPQECVTVTPGDDLITDFEDVSSEGVFVDSDSYRSRSDDWWLKFYGSPYVYPSRPEALTQSTADGSWRIQGTVAAWSGFGLWFGACTVDLSVFRGFSFDIAGSVGPSGKLKLFINTGPNTAPEACRSNVGSCTGGAAECRQPVTTLKLPSAEPATLTVLFDEAADGMPEATPDPAEILQFHFAFDWVDYNGAKAEAYPVDLTLDNFRLVR